MEVKSLKKQLIDLIICFLIVCFTLALVNTLIASSNEEPIEFSIIKQEQNSFSEIKVEVSSLGTFLRTDPEWKEDEPIIQRPTMIDLEAEGINNSKWVSINYSGELAFSTGKYLENEIVLIGLFSTTSEIKSNEQLNRVPGAIDTGRDYKSDDTYFYSLTTDISEDFLIMSPFENIIEIPRNAKFLVLCVADVYYPDNSGSIQVTLTKLEEYQVIFSIENLLIMFEVLFIVLVALYYRKK